MVKLSNSTGWDFESTIKFNVSTGEEHCEWFVCGDCGTIVAFDIKQVGFTVSSPFLPRPASCSRQFTPNKSTFGWHTAALISVYTEKKKWSHVKDLLDILAPSLANRQNCSHNRAAKHIKISFLPRESSLNHSWPSWILPQSIRNIHLSACPWFLAELDYCSKSINISTCVQRHPGMPGYKKRNRLRMSPILHPTDFAFFSLL